MIEICALGVTFKNRTISFSMCIDEKRKLVIPSDMGYGDRGAPPKIPGGATLVFEVELLKIERKEELK